MRLLSRRRFLAMAGAAAAGSAAPARAWDLATSGPRQVTVTANAFDDLLPFISGRTRFGTLDFLGGLVLTCPDAQFGGFSGLWVSPDGSDLIAIGDTGTWFSARILYDGTRLKGLDRAVLAGVYAPGSQSFGVGRRGDCEGLAISGGVAYVSLERRPELLRFALGRDAAQPDFRAPGVPVPSPPATRNLPANMGLEAIGILPAGRFAGTVIGIAEQSEPGDLSPTEGFFLHPARPGGFRMSRRDGFDITDLAFLPSGDMLVLERRFRLLDGVSARIRRIRLADIVPDALLDGPEIVMLPMATRIDNMEGLAVHRGRDGAPVLSLISDDNFSVLQKTVLLQFRLDG
jgi:hypothetical protein